MIDSYAAKGLTFSKVRSTLKLFILTLINCTDIDNVKVIGSYAAKGLTFSKVRSSGVYVVKE